MAQWLGQYSGRTHATRVEDLETALRHAVAAFKAASVDEERRRKAKSVRHLAKRVLSARMRALKARLVDAQRLRSEEALAERRAEIASLQQREASVREQGIMGILREFDAVAGEVCAGQM